MRRINTVYVAVLTAGAEFMAAVPGIPYIHPKKMPQNIPTVQMRAAVLGGSTCFVPAGFPCRSGTRGAMPLASALLVFGVKNVRPPVWLDRGCRLEKGFATGREKTGDLSKSRRLPNVHRAFCKKKSQCVVVRQGFFKKMLLESKDCLFIA